MCQEELSCSHRMAKKIFETFFSTSNITLVLSEKCQVVEAYEDGKYAKENEKERLRTFLVEKALPNKLFTDIGTFFNSKRCIQFPVE